MPYIDKSMSENAKKAYINGFFTLSKLKKETLLKNGFDYSVRFFKWLCKNGYINPSESHHTSFSYKISKFYSPKTIQYAVKSLNLKNLYSLYLKKETVENLRIKMNIKYARVVVGSSFIGIKTPPVVLDCIKYKNLLYLGVDTILSRDNNEKKIVDVWDNKPDNWVNKNTHKIIMKIISKSKVSWNTEMGRIER